MWCSLAALVLGFLLDLCIGDPHNFYHPIRLVGNLITVLEQSIRRILPKTAKAELAGGVILALLTVLAGTAVPALLLFVAGNLHPVLGFLAETIMCYQLLAAKALKDESMKVYGELKKGELLAARKAVSMIVGRDTSSLNEEGITKAAVETVAENTADGVVAPLIFMALGGPVLGYFYKSINTMDSMVGYKNEQYLYFGRFAAKLDDAVNYVPARISAYLMLAGTLFTGDRTKHALSVYRRDRMNHASPNSAHTEAVMAGALGIQLAGDAWYFGKLYKKKTIGEPLRHIEYEDIRRANRLLYVTAFLALFFVCAGKILVLLILG